MKLLILTLVILPLFSFASDENISYQISCETSPSFPPVQGNLLKFDSEDFTQIHNASGDWSTNGSGWFEQGFDVKVTALESTEPHQLSLLLFELKANKAVPHTGALEEMAPKFIHFLYSREDGKGSGVVRLNSGTQISVTCNRW